MKPLSFAVHPAGWKNQRRSVREYQQRISCNRSRVLPTQPSRHASYQTLHVAPVQQVDVMSTEDVVVGVILALVLAFSTSYARRDQTDVILWNNNEDDASLSADEPSSEGEVFGAESWKDISRPENYVLYNTEVRKKLEKRKNRSSESNSGDGKVRTEKRTVLIALLVLFVPIFSFEFFLGLSRQIICGGDPLTQTEWAHNLCSPHFEP